MAWVRCSGGNGGPAYIGLPELTGSITVYQQKDSNTFMCSIPNAKFEFDVNYTIASYSQQLEVQIYYNGAWTRLQLLPASGAGTKHYSISVAGYYNYNIRLRIATYNAGSYSGNYAAISNAIVTKSS